MSLARICSECPNRLEGRPDAKTCSSRCRAARSRRLARERKAIGQNSALPEHLKLLSASTLGEVDDVAREVLKEELRPVAREAITEDVLRSLNKLVALTPEVVDAIADDLRGDDAVLRQRAYTLVAKYTFGHGALVGDKDMDDSKTLNVFFRMPRPGDPGSEAHVEGAAVELIEDELRTCDMCNLEKPITEFVAGSARCVTCYEEQRDRARELLAPSD